MDGLGSTMSQCSHLFGCTPYRPKWGEKSERGWCWRGGNWWEKRQVASSQGLHRAMGPGAHHLPATSVDAWWALRVLVFAEQVMSRGGLEYRKIDGLKEPQFLDAVSRLFPTFVILVRFGYV